MRRVKVGNVSVGGGGGLVLIAGPCVIEDEGKTLGIVETLKSVTEEAGIPFIFKASYDKANRTSVNSYRGPGLKEGLKILEKAKTDFSVPILTDVHSAADCKAVAEVADCLQIPAFLCRQTDLLVEAGRTGRPVNIKKGQFMAPADMKHAAEKVLSTGNEGVTLTERGTSFGYNNLVVDFRGLSIMRDLEGGGFPVIFDATHSVQRPGGLGTSSGGDRSMVAHLARAAVAVGVDGVFIEVHPDPDNAPSDGPNSIALKDIAALVRELKGLDDFVRGGRGNR
ncbi:MAG: 3-deoxy-8-phosphooctulonate synthase [Thermodesulfobacteriota bacterium]